MSVIRVLSSHAIRTAYVELLPVFERATGNEVATTWAGIVDLTKRLKAGETTDLVLATAQLIDECIALGLVVKGSRVNHAKSGIGVALPAGAARTNISSSEALKQVLLAANTIAISSGPSGVYLRALFHRMGISDQVERKLIQTPSGTMVGGLLARRVAEIGFQQISELLPIEGIEFLGPLPANIQHMTVFAGGIHSEAKEPAGAAELMNFLTSTHAAEVMRKHGLESA